MADTASPPVPPTAVPDHLVRFGGIARLYGGLALERLRHAHVCIIGIGGVGSWAAEALARTGIGHITLIDMDDICKTNINRQLHALEHNTGQSKVTVMAARLRAINPAIQVNEVEDFITPDNPVEHLTSRFDYVFDAIDSFRVKAAIIAHCRYHKIPVITAGAAGGLIDPLCITVADLTRTIQDPLAKKTRDFLRYRYRFPSNRKRRFAVTCVFSTEMIRYPQPDGTLATTKPEKVSGMSCDSGLGTSTMVTASFGFVAASRIVQALLKDHRCRPPQ
ncbi:MAG: tRNA cyclic N6-threonylcarbamoyladenosine(37) synthase TcdA [Kistimonas sp.]|nr:tRNA cyclic N6-threonylcarbamoyladenosine(37) synthase TcdA [Kistimonas sp.]